MTRSRKILTVDRSHWLGYRWQGHGLDGRAGSDVLDDLLLLGVQGSRHAGAEQSLIQRAPAIGTMSVPEAISPNGPLVSLWSVRGAPHAHRVTCLDVVRDALAPRDTDDGGFAHAEAVAEVAAGLGAVVTAPTSKSEASREVTERVSASLVGWCARCEAAHVADGLFREAGRQAKIVLGPGDGQATMLHPSPDHRQEEVESPRLAFLHAYFRVNGPTSRTLYRDWVSGDNKASTELWSHLGDDLVRVQVDNRRADLPKALVNSVVGATEPKGIALVPPRDPYLRQVDRTLLVPDRKRRGEVWRALSGPGALLVDGEVAGTWRYRRSDHEVTITAFTSLASTQRKHAEKRARLLAEATGEDRPRVIWG